MWFNTSNVIPVGNGRLGAMILGGVPEESIMLNEDRIWSGSLNDPNPLNCSQNLPIVQDYIWKDALYDAQALADEVCMATTLKHKCIKVTAGNLTLAMHHADTFVAYNHTLDLTSAVAVTTYVTDGTEYTRTIFASHPDNIIVIHVTANVSSAVSYTASFATPMDDPVSVSSIKR
ncbi:glycosyl hydrolase family, N-terminal domain-containing protein [Mucidula mucida]|nr:glycosyl hydrolase family, N-terminal domain-containing protein [Mucidula mucida]